MPFASLAWSTIAVLLLLLPGFIFFVAIQVTERFTRESVRRSVIGTLAGAVGVSLVVHTTLLLAINGILCHVFPFIKCVDIRAALTAILAIQPYADGAASVVDLVIADMGWILAYFLMSVVASGFIGLRFGYSVAYGRGRVFGRHDWAYGLAQDVKFTEMLRRIVRRPPDRKAGPIERYWTREIYPWLVCFAWSRLYPDLTAENATHLQYLHAHGSGSDYAFFANVVSRIRSKEGDTLVYRGEIEDFGLSELGTVSYVVLQAPDRCYLKLPHYTQASLDHDWHPIGSSTSGEKKKKGRYPTGKQHKFYVREEDIEHIVFSRYAFEAPRQDVEPVSKAADQLRKQA